ncbi:MAG TPA: hypothetical protein PLO37_15995 [Candidatus Hydrogenedentes bacterium]|nr:hypothetical protein [Candidatus Hydrogenedentota bacterium]HPG68349.1 hypothetical protein [Candidatus Hydrogenedentota bacterium]
MKTAYELALERLEKASGPVKGLSNDQKRRIAEFDREYEARIAAVRLSYDQQMAAAKSADEWNALHAELAKEVASLEARREQAKDEIWGKAE